MTHVERMRLQAALQALRGALTVRMICLCSSIHDGVVSVRREPDAVNRDRMRGRVWYKSTTEHCDSDT